MHLCVRERFCVGGWVLFAAVNPKHLQPLPCKKLAAPQNMGKCSTQLNYATPIKVGCFNPVVF